MDARRVTARALEDCAADLRAHAPVRLVAAGKAARGMAEAARDALGDAIVDGVVTALDVPAPAGVAPGPAPLPWPVVPATHPLPGPGSEAAGRRALDLAAASARDGGVLLVCLSGGASAMLAVPAPGVSIEDKAAATAVLLRAGLPIEQLNLLRRQWSAIKGGRLGALAGRSVTLAISDVCVPGVLEAAVIGSGPTIGQPSRRAEARALVARAGLDRRLPASVLARLAADDDAVAPADERLRAAAFWVVAARHDATRAAAATARQLGYATVVVAEPVVGPAHEGWRALVDRADPLVRPMCVVASGETTVEVTGDGIGGRNQELAVAALEALARRAPAGLASIGTDGIDGPTDAAGAFVHSSMWRQLGPHARSICDDVVDRHDSHSLLDQLGGLVRTGPTGTNVGDLMVLLLPAEGHAP